MAEKQSPPIGTLVMSAFAGIFAFWVVTVPVFGVFTTSGNATQMANTQVEAVHRALAPTLYANACAAAAQADPDETKIITISTLSAGQQVTEIVRAGWTVIEGVTLSNQVQRLVATECGKKILAQKEA